MLTTVLEGRYSKELISENAIKNVGSYALLNGCAIMDHGLRFS